MHILSDGLNPVKLVLREYGFVTLRKRLLFIFI